MVQVDLRRVAAVLTQLVFQTSHHIAGVGGGHQEGTHAFLACRFVRHRNHNRYVTVLAAGDELLDAVNDVVPTLFGGGGAQCRGIGAHMRLRQAKRAQHFAPSQRVSHCCFCASLP